MYKSYNKKSKYTYVLILKYLYIQQFNNLKLEKDLVKEYFRVYVIIRVFYINLLLNFQFVSKNFTAWISWYGFDKLNTSYEFFVMSNF